MSKDSDDHSLMHRFSEELDTVCAEKGLSALSSFFDYTDLNYNMDDEFDEDESEDDDDEDENADAEDESTEDSETGLGYGIDDMQWFEASTGLSTLTGVRAALQAGALDKLKPDQRSGLIEELDNCISVLESTRPNSGKFHLAVIM